MQKDNLASQAPPATPCGPPNWLANGNNAQGRDADKIENVELVDVLVA